MLVVTSPPQVRVLWLHYLLAFYVVVLELRDPGPLNELLSLVGGLDSISSPEIGIRIE